MSGSVVGREQVDSTFWADARGGLMVGNRGRGAAARARDGPVLAGKLLVPFVPAGALNHAGRDSAINAYRQPLSCPS